MTNIFGKTLGRLLKKRKITQKELCGKLEISPGYLSDLKKGRRIGTEELISKIVEMLVLTREEELEIWISWTYERGHKPTMDYLLKLQEENKKLKKIFNEINEY